MRKNGIRSNCCMPVRRLLVYESFSECTYLRANRSFCATGGYLIVLERARLQNKSYIDPPKY